LKTDASWRQIDLHPDVADYLRKFVTGTSGLILHTKNGAPYLNDNLAEDWLDQRLAKLGLYEAGMGWHSFKGFRNSWLRAPAQRRQEDLRKFWLAHKPKDMGGLYSALKEDLPTRLAEAERVGYGFCFAEGSYSKCSTHDPHCMDCRISGLPRCAPVLLRLTSTLSGLRIRGKACLARLPARVKPPIPEAALQKEEPLWVPYLAPHWTWIN
jgi:hypothetical protein